MKGYRTKKIALPGGKVIEIVYFAEATGEGVAPVEGAVAERAEELLDEALDEPRHGTLELHVCPECDSDLVYPVSWEERAGDAWRIDRRCPNCEWRHVGEFSQDEVELFDDALNDGTEDLLVNLRSFARANMEDDVERMIEMIQLDRIEPMDF
jgi:hypothetical protein